MGAQCPGACYPFAHNRAIRVHDSVRERYIAFMRRSAIAIAAMLLPWGFADAQACKDIRTFDFKNTTIHVGPNDQNKLPPTIEGPNASAFNGPADAPDSFRLRDGTGLIYDDPNSAETLEWRVDLISDRLVHPDPSIWLRVIYLDRDHLAGTGTWYYVMAFACEKGRLVREFQFSSLGLLLKHLDDQTIQLDQEIWEPEDAHVDPSKHRVLTYHWNAQEHRYRRMTTAPVVALPPPP